MAAAQPLCMIPVMTDTILAKENARLKARLAETEAALADAVEAQRRLESIVSELRQEKFGRKSEKLDPEQFNLPLEDVEVAQGVLEAAQEKAQDALKGKGAGKSGKAKRNRGHLPKHLPRIERIIEPESTLCPCGCGEMARIGEGCLRTARCRAGPVPCTRYPPSEVRLSALLRGGGPGPCS